MAERVRVPASPRTAVVWSVLEGEVQRRAAASPGGAGLSALDVGGGSGVFAVPLASMGLAVTVVDVSADALATLRRRAEEAGVADRVTAVQGDADHLADTAPPGAYDLVLCHSLLEVVDDAAATTGTIAAALRPGGCASILVANRAATVLARALGGHLADAHRALTDPAGRYADTDGLRRRLDPASLTALIQSAGLVAEQLHGVGVVADLIPGALLESASGSAESLRELELIAAALPPYRDIATQLHALARRPALGSG